MLVRKPIRETIYIYTGKDFRVEFELQDGNNQPIDLTGMVFSAAHVSSGGVATAMLVDGTQLASGIVAFTLPKATTANLAVSSDDTWGADVTETGGEEFQFCLGDCKVATGVPA